MVEVFRQDHDAGPQDVGGFEELAEDFFGRPVRVRVCDVEGVDPAVVGVFEEGECLRSIEDPVLPV